MDVIVTWNMEHLANPNTRIRVREENIKKGLKIIDKYFSGDLLNNYDRKISIKKIR